MSDEANPDNLAAEGAIKGLIDESERILKKGNFQSVLIVATRFDGDKHSRCLSAKAGNYYASVGAVRLWVKSEESAEVFETWRRFYGDRGIPPEIHT
jgi:hypothetical protein